jgi:DNA-binding transcriptional MerR regulator
MTQILLEASDVARRLGRSPACVRLYARSGVLRPVVVTPRGGRLFRARDVERLRPLLKRSSPRRARRLRGGR